MSLPFWLSQWRNVAKEVFEQGSLVVRFLCLIHVADSYVCSPTLVLGPSMLPTLNVVGDVVLSEKLSHRLGALRSGDVVVVQSPLDPRKMLTKRIVGMPGDRVTFSQPGRMDVARSLVVPKGHVWIQGDNAYVSKDSREFGPLPYALIRGKVFIRVWPPSEFGPLNH